MPAFLIFVAMLVLGFFAFGAYKRHRDGAAPRGRPRVVEQLTDPREAGAILLVQQAAYEGRVTPSHKQVITALMTANFGMDDTEAEGLYGFGRMAAQQTGDAANSLRRLLAPVRERCTLAEMKDLAAMLVQVGETGGAMNEAQTRLVADVRRALSLPDDQLSGEPDDRPDDEAGEGPTEDDPGPDQPSA